MAGRDDDLTLLEDLAERMGLDEKQGESFVNQGMQKLGYRPRMDWDDPESDDNSNATDMFGGGSGGRRRQRDVGGERGGRGGRDAGRRSSGGDWQYG